MSEGEKCLQAALSHAIARTMENMTFDEIEVVDIPLNPEITRDGMWATLSILNPIKGEVVLELSRELGAQLAREVYGVAVGSAISDESVRDVIAEILNTLAGRFIDRLVASQFKFELGLPNTGNGRAHLNSRPVAAMVVSVGSHFLTTSVLGQDFESYCLNS